jgi:hypothetical protein
MAVGRYPAQDIREQNATELRAWGMAAVAATNFPNNLYPPDKTAYATGAQS